VARHIRPVSPGCADRGQRFFILLVGRRAAPCGQGKRGSALSNAPAQSGYVLLTVAKDGMERFAGMAEKFAAEGWLIPSSELKFGKPLGYGASGTTYAGTYKGRAVAIKAYSPTILERDAVSVKNEMQLMATLRHPNIIEFCGPCLSDDPPAASLVTAYAPRGELGHALYGNRALKKKGDAVRFRVAIGLAMGLQYLHGKGVIHRDIKPANILLDDDFNPMLTDFGFSRFIDNSGDMTGGMCRAPATRFFVFACWFLYAPPPSNATPVAVCAFAISLLLVAGCVVLCLLPTRLARTQKPGAIGTWRPK
jgi:serine/threonine protein kinase